MLSVYAVESWSTMRIVWRYQREHLQRLALEAGIPADGRRGQFKDALAFGEMLTLATDEAATRRLLGSDRPGALAFLDVLSDLDDAIGAADERPSTSELDGPFHELADFAVEFLVELRRMAPDKFD